MARTDAHRHAFRHAGTPSPSLEDAADMAAAVRKALARHPYLSNATIIEQPEALPDDVCEHLKDAGLDPLRIKGAYSNGNPYIVAGNLASVEDGLRTALHEVVGHHGVRAVLGEHFEPVMHDLYESFPREHDAWQTTVLRYGYLDTGTEAGQVAFAEELVAHMAEEDVTLNDYEMVQAEIRASLREQVPDLPVMDNEVRALIQRSRESLIVRHGYPEAVEAVRERQAHRGEIKPEVEALNAYAGEFSPDAFALALYREGGQVKNIKGLPCRLYHGSDSQVPKVNGIFWGSTDSFLANHYADFRGHKSGNDTSVVPFYADIKTPFDGDGLKQAYSDSSLTVSVFFAELIRQSGVSDSTKARIRDIGEDVERDALWPEEGASSYKPHHFWYYTDRFFGQEGADLLQDAFELAGFDGVSFTEGVEKTYGAFHPSQLHFLDQGASPRGWQPDRHHGEGPAIERPAFKEWFGDSVVTNPAGSPRVMYCATAHAREHFDTRAMEHQYGDATERSGYGFWFNATPENELPLDVSPSTMPVYLAIQNPANMDLVDMLAQTEGASSWCKATRSQQKTVRECLQRHGFDGFFVETAGDISKGDLPALSAVAFEPEQIKSAIGNRGTYLQNHPDIRFALGDPGASQPSNNVTLEDPVCVQAMNHDTPDIPPAPGPIPSMG